MWDDSYFSDLAKRSAEARGAHVWSELEEIALFGLVQEQSNFWSGKSHADGRPNWNLIATYLSNLLGIQFSYKQVFEKYRDILARLEDDYPELIEQYEYTYYIAEARVNWESMLKTVIELIEVGNFKYNNGSYVGRPKWYSILLELQNKGYLNDANLEDVDVVKGLVKQLSKAYNKYLNTIKLNSNY